MNALNPNIILGIQQPDLVGAQARGAQAAGTINAVRENNALAPFRMEQAQLGVQQGRANLELTGARLKQITEEAKRATVEAAQREDAAELAAELRIQKSIVAQALADPENADRYFASHPSTRRYVGQPPEAVGAGLIGAEDGLTEVQKFIQAQQPPKPEFAVTDGHFYDKNNPQAGAQPVPGLPQDTSGMVVESDGQGGFRFVQGAAAGAAANKPLTEAQSKDNVYATRAKGALDRLEGTGSASLTSRTDRVLGAVPMGIGREAQSQEFQVAEQAGEEFLQAILRKDTGAAITEQEQVMYGRTFLPQPGDGPAVLAAKEESRARAVAALEAGMSAQQILQTEQAVIKAAQQVEETRSENGGPQPGAVEDGYRFKGGDPADPANWERAD